MAKKFLLALLLAAVVTGAAFAQENAGGLKTVPFVGLEPHESGAFDTQ